MPGDTGMIAFSSASRNQTSTVFYGRQAPQNTWVALKASGVTAYGASVTIPSDFKVGEFDLKIGEAGSAFSVNVPRPWFAFGDQGDFSTPGGWVRIIGIALGLGNDAAPELHLTLPDGKALSIDGRKSVADSRSQAIFDIPTSLKPGNYSAAISSGGKKANLCTYLDNNTPCLSQITIKTLPLWKDPTKQKIFTVSKIGSDFGGNSTAAVHEALSQAAKYGPGSVVYFPRGRYLVTGPILIPEGTIIRGEERELVSIYFHEATQHTAPPAYITGASSSQANFGVENITFYITAYANDIVGFQVTSDGCFFRNSRIRYNSYFAVEPEKGSGSRGRFANWNHDVGTAIRLRGKNLQITDNDIYSSGDCVSTRDNQVNGIGGAAYMHIARNRFYNGGTTHWGISWKQSIFEDNESIGTSITSMGSNYPPAYAGGVPWAHTQYIYHHNNSFRLVWGNDREMMTCDATVGVYFGHIDVKASKPTEIHLVTKASGPQLNGNMCVLEGTGTGECRRVTHYDSTFQIWTINTPFTLPLDATSRINIATFVGNIAFNGNQYEDGGAVQFYGSAFDIQANGNKFERMGGLLAWGRGQVVGKGWGPNFRNQFLDNEFVEGNHVYNYNTQEPAGTGWPYHFGGSKTPEPYSIGSMTNDQGLPTDPGNGHNPPPGSPDRFDGALNRFIVFRGNHIKNNGGIVVRGTSANVLVQNNTIEASDVGIHVNTTTTKGGIVLVQNSLPL
eukprot:g3605.t1